MEMNNSNEEIKISIIMPSFNVVNYIRECMDSVVNQTLKEIEIIVVDANSTDGTFEILKEYEAKDSRVHILIDDKASTGYANNKAIDFAKGKYIGIVETDDFIRLDMYEKLYQIAEDTGCDIVKGDYDSFSGDGDKRRYVKHHLAPTKAYDRVLYPKKDNEIFEYVMFNWAGIYNHKFLIENDIRHQETKGASFQDNGFFFLAYSYAEKVFFVRESFYRYRRDNPNSSINNPNKVFCMCDEYDFIEKKLKTTSDVWDRVKYPYLKRRYGACSWTLKKVKKDYRDDLIARMQADFQRLISSYDEIDLIQSKREYQEEMKALLYNPDEYKSIVFRKQERFETNICRLVKLLQKYRVIIVGCGERGTRLECILHSRGIMVATFADNNALLSGENWNGISVLPLSDAVENSENDYYVITPQKEKKRIKKQLLELGVNNQNIFFYNESFYVWD